LPDAAHGHVLRSPHAHAAIERIELAAARAAPGVLGVYIEADLAADGIGPLPCVAQFATVDPMIVPPRWALARGLVRHVGDPVAFVVAESRERARDAAELIRVDYRPLAAVTEAPAALEPGAPAIWDEAPGNLCFCFRRGDKSATDAAFAAAAHVVEIVLVNNRVAPTPIEPRAAIGRHDKAGEILHLLLTGQGVHGIRSQLAQPVFHLPDDRVHLAALGLRRADPVLAHAELGPGASEARARRSRVLRSRVAGGQGHRRRLQILHRLFSRHKNLARDSHQQF
jgi:carbon-monoxide dehydrogenase large subunit